MTMQSLVRAVKSIKFWRANSVDRLNLPPSSKMVLYHLYLVKSTYLENLIFYLK